MKRLSRHERPITENDENGKVIKNPNKITVNQHVIPNRHLLEWSNDGNNVYLHDIATGLIKNLPTSNPYFCVMRLWDQWTETQMLKSNEDNYQVQINLMRQGCPFTHIEHIMAYYVMLCVRTCVANQERPHYQSIFSNLFYEYNKSELEDNELEMESTVHVIKSTINTNSQHSDRQIVKDFMNDAFRQGCGSLKDQDWKVYQSKGENFLLSDAFYKNFLKKIHVLPISPEKILIAESTYSFLKKNEHLSVNYINEVMRQNAVNFYVIPQGMKSLTSQ